MNCQRDTNGDGDCGRALCPNGCGLAAVRPEREATVTFRTDKGGRVQLHLARLGDDTKLQDWRWLVCYGVSALSRACAFDTWEEAMAEAKGRVAQAVADGWTVEMVTQGRKR